MLPYRVAIRIGLYQLLFLERIPDYSAINESVGLVQRAKKTSAKGFVNAILRRATREKPVFQYADETERISVETSHPRWLIEKWIGEFGAGDAELLAAANNETPKPAFRLTRSFEGIDPEITSNWRRSEFVEGCYLTEKSSAELREFEESRCDLFSGRGVADGGSGSRDSKWGPVFRRLRGTRRKNRFDCSAVRRQISRLRRPATCIGGVLNI